MNATDAAGPSPTTRRPGAWSRRILVVEDEVGLREVFQRFLETRGFACQAVADAETAARLLEGTYDWDLVVSDVRLPGASGVDLLLRIRNDWPDLPVLLVSGGDHLAAQTAARRLGATFLPKPFSLLALLEAVLDALEAGGCELE